MTNEKKQAAFVEQLRGIDSCVLAGVLTPYPGKRHVLTEEVKRKRHKPTLEEKIKAATWIASMGINHSGVRTQATLMWPLESFTEYMVAKEAADFMGNLLAALLRALPPQEIDTILKQQAQCQMCRCGQLKTPSDNNQMLTEQCRQHGPPDSSL